MRKYTSEIATVFSLKGNNESFMQCVTKLVSARAMPVTVFRTFNF